MTDKTTAEAATETTGAATDTGAAPSTSEATAATDTTAAATTGGDAGAAEGGSTAGTLADGTDDDGKEGAATWPDNWRDLLAGEDKKALEQLKRYQSPQGVWNKIKNLEKALNEKGRKPARPGDGASDEEIAAYRKEAGLPETPEGYFEALKLSDGRVIGDDDKPVAESFLKAVHGADYTPEQASKALDWYYDHLEEVTTQQIEADDAFRQESRDALRDEWGQEFKRNVNAIGAVFAEAPDGLKEAIFGARDPSGRLLGDNPDFVRFMSRLAFEINPAASIAPTAEAGGKGVDARLAELTSMMGDRSSAYWRGPQADALQEEYRNLIETKNRLQSRQRAA